MSIKPNLLFELWTPDEVAECLPYIPRDLYSRLWDFVNEYEPIDRENCGPNDVIGINALSKFWDKLTPKQQRKLNELAKDFM